MKSAGRRAAQARSEHVGSTRHGQDDTLAEVLGRGRNADEGVSLCEGHADTFPLAAINRPETSKRQARGTRVIRKIPHPDLGRRCHARAPYRSSAKPWRQRGPATPSVSTTPRLRRPASTRRRIAAPRAGGTEARLPVAGVRVTIFTWIGAGSYATRYGDLGPTRSRSKASGASIR